MSGSLSDALVRSSDAHRRGAIVLLLFDYDGTLVPIAERPWLAVLSGRTRRQLERFIRLPSLAVGVLSGRRIDELRDVAGIEGLFYAGTGGLELSLGGTTIAHPLSDRAIPLVIAVAERVRRAIAGHEGAWVEQKPLGLTVHYRGVDSDRIDALKADVFQTLEPCRRSLRVFDGPMAIEIMPDLGWTKGSALRMIAAHVGATGNPVLPFYAGDDANDADALAAAAALGGVAVGIGPCAPPAAQVPPAGSRIAQPSSRRVSGHARRWLNAPGGPPEPAHDFASVRTKQV